MSGPSIHELLGLPAEITQPSAYEVFGLQLGEADQQIIRSAIEQRVIALREAKSSASPNVWAKAARAIQTAQKVLTDPQKKASLDAQYGIINDPEPVTSAAFDPLAALLPGAGTSAPSAAYAAPTAENPVAQPAIPIATSAVSQPGAVARPAVPLPAIDAQPIAAHPIPVRAVGLSGASRRPVRRRRSWGGLIFQSLVLLLLAAITGGLGYAFLNEGGIQLVKNDEGFQISTGKNVGHADLPKTAPPRPETKKPQGDGIMNPPPPTRPRQSNAADDRAPQMGSPAGMDSRMSAASDSGAEMSSGMSSMSPEMTSESPTKPAPDPNAAPKPNATPEPMSPAVPAPAVPTPTPPPGANKPAATPEEIAAGDAAIAAARAAITGAKWESMKSLAETAEAKAATEQQQQNAETLFQFADLATFYHGAIRRAMADLVAGNEFKLTDSLTFLVQQSSADRITLYRNKREYPYSLAELPLSVAHALAPFQLNASAPEGKAAKAVFQAISPMATPGHRRESAEILRGLDRVQGADPKRLADFIESLQ